MAPSKKKQAQRRRGQRQTAQQTPEANVEEAWVVETPTTFIASATDLQQDIPNPAVPQESSTSNEKPLVSTFYWLRVPELTLTNA